MSPVYNTEIILIETHFAATCFPVFLFEGFVYKKIQDRN